MCVNLGREERVILRDRRAGAGSPVVETGGLWVCPLCPTAMNRWAFPLQAAPLAAKPYSQED